MCSSGGRKFGSRVPCPCVFVASIDADDATLVRSAKTPLRAVVVPAPQEREGRGTHVLVVPARSKARGTPPNVYTKLPIVIAPARS